jgi:subtilase family serine protease
MSRSSFCSSHSSSLRLLRSSPSARRRLGHFAALAAAAAAVACSAAPGDDALSSGQSAQPLAANATTARLTPNLRHTQVTALADAASGPPAGAFGPLDLEVAYSLNSTASGAGETVAIVIPFHDPQLLADVNVYRKQYSLTPLGSCAVTSPCLSEIYVNDDGLTSTVPAATNANWQGTAQAMVEMASAACPSCNVLVAEASDDSGNAGFAAVGAAAQAGASAVVIPWGQPNEDATLEHYLNVPGVLVTVAAGSYGFASGVTYPSTSAYVLSVGGTTLSPFASGSRPYGETAWSDLPSYGTQSGCSAVIQKPAWQNDTPAEGCARRATSRRWRTTSRPTTPLTGGGPWTAPRQPRRSSPPSSCARGSRRAGRRSRGPTPRSSTT